MSKNIAILGALMTCSVIHKQGWEMRHKNYSEAKNAITTIGAQTLSQPKFKTLGRFNIRFALLGLFLSTSISFAAQIDALGPPGSGRFGDQVTVLPNGNFVVTDPSFDLSNPTVVDVGAAYLYAPDGVQVSQLTGSSANDRVGKGGVTVLSNGNYVLVSQHWNARSAITWGSATLGVSGTVSSANSLIGRGGATVVTALNNGNYVVSSIEWDKPGPNRIHDVGALTWGSGTTGVSGVISAANSLIGSSASDQMGTNLDGDPRNMVTALNNGNYVVVSMNWDAVNPALYDVGAVTWGNGVTGTSGEISVSNSYIGASEGDRIGWSGYGLSASTPGVTALTNGNYIFGSLAWHSSLPAGVGAVTWGNGAIGSAGYISSANSMVGSSLGDNIGSSGIIALANGNYVIASPNWSALAPAIERVGAATWGNGATGTTGIVSPTNSLVGSQARDRVGNRVTPLSNGNYVVGSSAWSSSEPTVLNVGAVTWGNGMSGTFGVVSELNSLVGSSFSDFVGDYGAVVALTNGNYVVHSSVWDNASTQVANVGAVTWGNGLGGTTGKVSVANSVIGSSVADQVGFGFNDSYALNNGNYVIASSVWDNGLAVDAGAITWGNGSTGTTGVLSPTNSLVGSSTNDRVGGNPIYLLGNGNYVVSSVLWDAAEIDAGAVTWGNGLGGTIGAISANNSLVGSNANDRVGEVLELSDDSYAVISDGAVSLGGPLGLSGQINTSNSVVGVTAGSIFAVAYDKTRKHLIVGRSASNTVSIFGDQVGSLFANGFE